MSPLRLTKLGRFVQMYSVTTEPSWWRSLWKTANRVADDDGDLALWFNERIDGLTEMRDRFYDLNNEDDTA